MIRLSFFIALLCLAAPGIHAQVIPASGLIALYRFAGNAHDTSGNNHHMTVSGAQLCPDRFGRPNHAYRFDGINDYIAYSTTLPQDTEYTYSFWYLSEQMVQRGDIIHNGHGGNSGVGVLQNGGTSSPNAAGSQVTFFAGGVNFFFGTPTTVNDWHHVVVRVDTDSFDFFYDNVLLYSGPFTSLPPVGQFYVGYNFLGGTDAFEGRVDDIAVYNRSITNAEIDTLFRYCEQQIVSGPANTSVLAGLTALFTVSTTPSAQQSFQWQMDSGTGFVNLTNAGPFSGTQDDTLILSNTTLALHNNVFRVIVSNDLQCDDTSAGASLQVTPNSIPDPSTSVGIRICPNPSAGTVQVEISGTTPDKLYFLEVTDMMGRRIYTGRANPGNTLLTIENEGVNVLTVSSADGLILSKQVFIVH